MLIFVLFHLAKLSFKLLKGEDVIFEHAYLIFHV